MLGYVARIAFGIRVYKAHILLYIISTISTPLPKGGRITKGSFCLSVCLSV